MLNLALVNGFSPAIGNSFPVLTFGSRTGQFATINGLALGNGKQFTPAYTATNLTLDVTTAAPIPAMPDSDGRGGGVRDKRRQVNGRAASPTRRTDPHDPASFFRISKIDKSATGTQLQFGTATGKTYRLEYTDDLRSGWQVLLDILTRIMICEFAPGNFPKT